MINCSLNLMCTQCQCEHNVICNGAIPLFWANNILSRVKWAFDRHIFSYKCREGNQIIAYWNNWIKWFLRNSRAFFCNFPFLDLQSNFQITLAFLLDTTKFLIQVDFYWTPRLLPVDLHKFSWNATGILLELRMEI